MACERDGDRRLRRSCRHCLQLLAYALIATFYTDRIQWDMQAYNAGFVRVKAKGLLPEIFNAVDPSLLSSLKSIADCPAVPSTYPFPAWIVGSRLDKILSARQVVVAQQFLNFPAFQTAFTAVTDAIVAEIAAAYNTPLLNTSYVRFVTSDEAVDSILAGKADCTDSFYRQWSLTVSNQVQRSVQLTPACTLWAATLSISWNEARNGWKTIEGNNPNMRIHGSYFYSQYSPSNCHSQLRSIEHDWP